jgi:hypothetical protein
LFFFDARERLQAGTQSLSPSGGIVRLKDEEEKAEAARQGQQLPPRTSI